MRLVLLVTTLCVALATPLRGQEGTADVLAGLRNGGGWVGIPIEAGRGRLSTMTLPTMGMTLSGCVNVWHGHSGSFEIRAHDTVSDSALTASAEPGVGVTFAHTFGMSAQLDFDFMWSERRDTTLVMWVGVAIGRTAEEACEPPTGG